MGKTIYIQCYEGLSAKMLVEALLNLMPEEKQARATVDQLMALNCPDEVKIAMIRRLPRKIKDFALPEGAEELFNRAYDIWLHAKAAVQKLNIAHVEFRKEEYDEVIAMLAAAICLERLQADTIICPIVYDGYGQIYVEHEPVSVPLPETLYILMGAEIAMHRMEQDSAWVTPQGAALLAACRTFDHLPEDYHVSKIGTGRGTASDGSNSVLRIMVLDETEEKENSVQTEAPVTRDTNWDDDLEFLEESIINQTMAEAKHLFAEKVEKNAFAEQAPEADAEEDIIEERLKKAEDFLEVPSEQTEHSAVDLSEETVGDAYMEVPSETKSAEPSADTCSEKIVSENSAEGDSEPEVSEDETEELAETEMAANAEVTVQEDIVLRDAETPDKIWKLECNIDDCGGEVLGYTMERLMQEGALDACYLPIFMKKNRPAYMMTVLCRQGDREKMEEIIFEETTTIGIRRVLMERSILPRRKSKEQTSFGEVAVKTMTKKCGDVPTLEYDSVAAIAREQHLPFREVYRRIEKELS